MAKELTEDQKKMLAQGLDKRRMVMQMGTLPLIQLVNAAANGETVALKVTGLPTGSKVIGSALNEVAGFVALVVQHESFDWVPEMSYPPVLETKVEVVRVEPAKAADADADKGKGKAGAAGKEGGKP